MRRLLFVLAAIGFWAWTPAQAQLPAPTGPAYLSPCNQFSQGTATATTTQLAAPSAVQTSAISNKGLYVCGWQITATAPTTFQLIGGAGATCGTSTVNLTPVTNVATTPVTLTGATAAVFVAPTAASAAATNGLCIVSGASAITFLVLWAQY